MKTNLTFDFIVNKENNTIRVVREFAANRSLVWEAFTQAEILDQWWAPKPWTSITKLMEFKEGGRRLYAMCSPEGEQHWAIQDFTSISPRDNFKFIDAFSDENGNINNDLPGSQWSLDFIDNTTFTKVDILITHRSLADLEALIQMGFKEGFTMTLNELSNLLVTLSKK